MQDVIQITRYMHEFRHIMEVKFKLLERKQVLDIRQVSGKQIIHANDVVSFLNETITKVGAEKSGSAGDEYFFHCVKFVANITQKSAKNHYFILLLCLLLQKNYNMRFTLVVLAAFLAFSLPAQESAQNKGNGILLNFTFGGQLPGGDLVDRFGANLNVGGGVDFMTEKSNLIFGLEGYFLFGNTVKEDVLEPLRTPNGTIIGNDRNPVDVPLRERGFYLGATFGKLFSLSQKNPRSGIRATVGAGLLQHNIRIQDDPVSAIPQLSEPYKKGYDRLSNGLAFNEFIGYQYLSTDKRINFFAGFEFTQALTQSRRDFNFDTRNQDTEQRLDLLWGIRVGWVLPFYVGKSAGEIYY